jgi:short-subunit dehydrogenase
MRGKTIVVTGATSGIGEIAAVRLAEQGARIVFTARDEKRGHATMEKLSHANGASEHVMHLADLSLIAEQKRVAGVPPSPGSMC